MTRYNTIHKVNDTWGSYKAKGKMPQWVNLKTGECYDIKNKETFTEFLKRLKETNNMKTFTFTYDFSDVDTATMASDGITGYMIGTYHKPKIEIAIKGKGQLVIDYQAHKKHSRAFKRICDAFVPAA